LANIKSAQKRVRSDKKKNLRNRMVKTGVKTAVKKYTVALEGDLQAAPAALRNASSALDKAVSKGILHKNNAAHKKSRVAHTLARL